MSQYEVDNSADLELRCNVMDELDFEPSVHSANIGVAAEGGIVTLSGHVGSYAEKLAAEKAARRVRGVKAIADHIKVRFAEDKKVADDEIARRIVDILHWSAMVPEGAVTVKVQDGWVGLGGEVKWNYQRTAIEVLIHRLSGIKGIVNGVTIESYPDPLAVKRKIEDALGRNASVCASKISVSVEDTGRVLLEGDVHDWRERNAIEDAAWSAPGVRWVEDRLNFDRLGP
jgi:osmotically-inducible protein OsmY